MIAAADHRGPASGTRRTSASSGDLLSRLLLLESKRLLSLSLQFPHGVGVAGWVAGLARVAVGQREQLPSIAIFSCRQATRWPRTQLRQAPQGTWARRRRSR